MKWLMGVAGAVLLVSAAVGIPLLIQAESSSTNRVGGVELRADFQLNDATSGVALLGFVDASTTSQAVTTRTSGPGLSGPGHVGGTTQTFTGSSISVFGEVLDEDGKVILTGSGFATPSTITAARDLSTGELVATVDMELSTPTGVDFGMFSMTIDLDFQAIGGLTTSRDIGHERSTEPRQMFNSTQTSSFRNAQATGSATLLGINFAGDGSTFASMSQFDSTFGSRTP